MAKILPIESIADHEYKLEIEKQEDWKNWIFSLTTFALTLTCLQFKVPGKAAMLCLIVVAPMFWRATHDIPKQLKAVRKRIKDANSPRVSDVAEERRLISTHHGWKSLLRHVPFLLTTVFYAVVLFDRSPSFVEWIKS